MKKMLIVRNELRCELRLILNLSPTEPCYAMSL